MAEPKVSPWPVVIISIFVVAAGIAAGVFVYEVFNKPLPGPSQQVVVEGDNVTVNYIGSFGSGFDQGKVFDTSYLSVATDNATYPKAISFQFRGASGYTPLKAHVGPNTEGAYTSLITGFWKGMLGLAPNQTTTVVIPPSQGYGAANPANLLTLPLTQQVPMVTTYSASEFGKNFSGIAAQNGAVFTDPHYGWQDTVINQNATSVTVESLPYVGEIVKPYGWSELVTQVSSTTSPQGQITLVNELTPQDVGQYKGTYLSNGKSFYLSNVNLNASTYTLDFNQEVQGNVLVFVISVYSIVSTPPTA